MTHPTDGTRGIMHRGARRGARDSIRDGANRIDAREQLRPRRRLDVFHSQPFESVTSGCTLAQVVALFLQKSFRVFGGQELGIDLGREDWRCAKPQVGGMWKCMFWVFTFSVLRAATAPSNRLLKIGRAHV